MPLFHRSRIRLTLREALLVVLLTPLALRAQTGDPTSSQNQGVRAIGSNPQPGDGFVGASLFAYGPTYTTDRALPRSDDGVTDAFAVYYPEFAHVSAAGTSLSFAGAGQSLSYASGSINIGVNGFITFGGSSPPSFLSSLSTVTQPTIAAFLTDISTQANSNPNTPSGNVWFRFTRDTAVLSDVATRVENAFAGTQGFNPLGAYVVTWDKVGAWNSGGADNTKVNTFQVVLATDGVNTYALALYPENGIWWDSPTYQPALAGIGYTDGSGQNLVEPSFSRTTDVRDVWFLSNTADNAPGTFVYNVGGTLAPITVNGTYTVPSGGAFTSTLQFSANAAGHTINTNSAGWGVTFGRLRFDNPSNQATFNSVAIATSSDAITQGNLIFNYSTLVANATHALNGGAITLRGNAKLLPYVANAGTEATTVTFVREGSTDKPTVDLRGFDLTLGALTSATGSGVITNSGGTPATFTIGGSASGIFGGTIEDGSSVLNLVRTGSGSQILNGTNTYTGTTTVNAGTLVFDSLASFYGGNVNATNLAKLTVESGGLASFSTTNYGAQMGTILAHTNFAGGAVGFHTFGVYSYSGNIEGNVGIGISGAGLVTLSGTNTYTGTTLINGGTLIPSASGSLGSGVISFGGGSLRLTPANTTDYSARFSSAAGQLYSVDMFGTSATFASPLTSPGGSLTLSGGGLLTLTAANTYTGATTVSAGMLRLSGNGRLADTSALSISSGATFDLNGISDTIGSLAGNGNVSLGAGALTAGGDNTSTVYGGIISGSGSFTKSGAGTLTLANINSYTGATTISSGTLALSGAGRLSSSTALTIASGATFNVNSINTGALTIGSLAGAGSVALGTKVLTSSGNNTDTIFSGTASGTGGLTKAGTGTLTLSGTNTYTGTTTVSAGTLQLGAGATTGSIVGNIVNNAALNFNRSDALSFANVISGSGAVTQAGTSTLTLSGANTYTGATTVSAGTLRLSGSARLSDTALLTVASGATFDLNGLTDTIGSLAGAGSVSLGAGALTAGGDNATTTFSGVISGSGSFTKAGIGTLTLSGANTYTGATTVSAGTLRLSGSARLSDTALLTVASGATFDLNGLTDTIGSLAGAGNVTLGAGALTAGGDHATTTFSGVISGSGAFTKTGTGTLTLTGANTFSGPTTLAAGTLQIGAGGTAGSVTGNITNHAALAFNRSDALTYSGVISGSGALTQAGTGTLTLTGANTYSGGTTISAGTLVGNATSLQGAIVNQAAVVFNQAGTGTFSGVISGSGSLTKSGAGTLTLAGANTYSGATTLAAGTLALGHSLALQNSLVTLTGDGSLSFGTLTAASLGGLSGESALALTNGSTGVTLTVGSSGASTSYGGVLSGGGALIKTGGGTLTLTGANTYTGGTTVSAGWLAGDSTSLRGAITNNSGLHFNQATDGTFTGTLSGAGTFLKSGAGTLTLLDQAHALAGGSIEAGTLRLSGDLTINSVAVGLNGSLAVSQGSVSLGTLQVYEAATIAVSGGTLALPNLVVSGTDTARLNLSGGTINASEYTILGQQYGEQAEMTLSGGTLNTTEFYVGYFGGRGTLTQTGGTLSVSGNSYIGYWMGDLGAADATVSGGNWTTAGTLYFGELGTGNLTVTGGTVAANQIELIFSDYSDHHVNVGGTGVLETARIVGAGTLTLAGGTLRVTASGTFTDNPMELHSGASTIDTQGFSVQLAHPLTGAGGLIKAGSGQLLLGVANTFSGGTTIDAGTLRLGHALALQNSTVSVSTLGTLSFGGLNTATFGGLAGDQAIALTNGSAGVALTVGGNGASTTYGGALSANGSLTKVGAGTLTLTGDNTYSSGTTISAGTLQVGNGGTTGSLVGDVFNHAALAFNRADALTYSGPIVGPGSVTQLGAGTLTLSGANSYSGGTAINAGRLALDGANAIGHSGTISFGGGILQFSATNTRDYSARFSNATGQVYALDTNGQHVTLASALGGAGNALTKFGAGTLTLSAVNTFSGPVTISGGTLRQGVASAVPTNVSVIMAPGTTLDLQGFASTLGSLSGAGTVTLGTGGSLTLNQSGDTTFAGAIIDPGSFTKTGAGTLTLSGTNTYTGATTISAGTLQIGAGATTGSLTGNITNHAALVFNRSDTVTFSGIISGAGAVTKLGAGTLVLTGTHTYTGATTIDAGTLLVNGSLAQTAVSLASGATLGGSGTIGGLTTIATGAHLAPGNSPGTLTFTHGLTLSDGAILDFQLGDPLGGPGVASDLIVVSGGTLTGSASAHGLTLNLTDAGGFGAGTYDLIRYAGATTDSFDFTDFHVGSGIAGYTYAFSFNGTTLQLTATAVPEPATYAMLAGAAALALAAWRRRRRSVSDK